MVTLNGAGQQDVWHGSPMVQTTIGGVLLTPTLGGTEHVTIDGTTTIRIGSLPLTGRSPTLAPLGVLNVNNLTVTITNTARGLRGGASAVPADLPTADPVAPLILSSSNAVTIDASASGGLITPFGDANFVPGNGLSR